jgi:hypothetical protein
MTTPTKSFIGLASVAVILSALTLLLNEVSIQKPRPLASDASELSGDRSILQEPGTITFDEPLFGIRFQYPDSWAQEVAKENGFNTINLFPPQSQTPISIHVGSAYYGLSTLRSSTVTINGYTGISAGEGLVGLTHNNKFYTFDIGTHTAYLAEFNDLLKTISLY